MKSTLYGDTPRGDAVCECSTHVRVRQLHRRADLSEGGCRPASRFSRRMRVKEQPSV